MPCFSINLIAVELIATDRDLLEQALKELGYQYTRIGNDFLFHSSNVSIQGNKLIGDGLGQLNAIKRQYSIEVVKQVAKKKSWVGAWRMTGKNRTGNTVTLKKY